MQRSRFDMRGADAGAGGMSISSGMGASSSSSDASSMGPVHGLRLLKLRKTGHVAELQSAVRRGCSTVRRELLLHGGHRALAGVDAGRVPEKDPRLPFLDRVQHVVQNGRELQDRGRGGPAVKHRTSVTFMMCSFSRVMSAGDSMLLLPRVSARGALRFQR